MKMRGFMKRITAILALLCLFIVTLAAQTPGIDAFDFETLDEQGDSYTIFETTSETTEETEPDFVYKPNQQGDQFVRLNLALELPLSPKQLHYGGTGTLSYGMFLTENINLSAKISFAYTTTIGDNIFYFIPFTLCAQYQILFKNFEIPLSLDIGCALENYIDRLYFGLVLKPEAGFFYRISPDWSIGAYTGVFIMPQWYSDKKYNATGYISDIGLSVRYHF